MKRSSLSDRAPRLAVFCSGRGTNLQAILDAVKTRRLRATIAVVLSDTPAARALTRARRRQIPTAVVDRRQFAGRPAFERAIRSVLRAHRVQYIALAGFMRILSPALVRRYRGRMLNIHPALLPAFPGAHPIRDTLRYGAHITGVTVHFVDGGVDSGPVILQEAVAVDPRETEGALLRKLHRMEHRLYPRALQLLLNGKLRLSGRKVTVSQSQ